MKRIICLMIGIVFLFTAGCAGNVTQTATQTQTADAFAAAYSQAILQQGISIGEAEEDEGNQTVLYRLSGDALSDGARVWFLIQKENQVVTAAGIEYYHPGDKAADLNAFLSLSTTLLQVCDPSLANKQETASKRLTEIIQSCMQGEELQKDGFRYAALGNGWNTTSFLVEYPGYEDEEEPATLTGIKALPFTAEEVASTLGEITAKSQIHVKPIQQSMSAIPELSNLPKDGSPKVYALEHGLGITVGWLVFYSSDAGLVQIDFVDRDDGDLLIYVIQLYLPDALVQACDPVLRLEDTKENQDKAHDIASDLFYYDPIVENGIQYQKEYENDVSFIVVTAQ